MESVGTICEGEWNNSFNASCSEEADFMAQLLGNCSFPNEVQIGPNIALSSSFWGPNENSMYSSDDSSFSFPLGGTNLVGYYPVNNSMTTDYFMMDGKNNGSRVANDDIVEGDVYLRQDIANGPYVESPEEDDLPGKTLHLGIEKRPSEMSKKRHRLPLDVQRKGKLKKCAKIDDDDDMSKPTKVVPRRPSSSVCSEEDDSTASHEVNGLTSSSSSKGSGALNLSGKTRANRGSATDPQSLYARKRRERINERLRILQNLVPNGTKVDLSTMLEEAVQYVKFLQLQIKLLSSDELWMYAPIAYNGMDIGLLDINIPTPNSQS